MEKLTKTEKLEATDFMLDEINDIKENCLYDHYALCDIFFEWYENNIGIVNEEDDKKIIEVFPEFFNPINILKSERDSIFAWNKYDYTSRKEFLLNLRDEVKSS